MKSYIVTFYYEDNTTFQSVVPENLIDQYIKSIKDEEPFWNENRTYGALFFKTALKRIQITENQQK